VAPVVEGRLPSLSVVIPTARGGDDLASCLGSLWNEDYPGLEVIVVHSSSPGSVSSRPERLSGVHVIRSEKDLGFVGACNLGAEGSNGELVLFLNDDTVVEPGALRTFVETLLEHPAWGGCQAKLLLMDDPSLLDTAGSFLTRTGFLVHRGAYGAESDYVLSDEIFAAKGAALLVRRRALDEVGVFDPEFFAYFEDSDLCWRLWVAGWVVGFAADAHIRHRLGSTASTLPLDLVQFHSFKNRIRSLLKNLGPARLIVRVPVHLAICLGLVGWFAVTGSPGLSRAIARAIAWNVRHARSTMRARAVVQGRRRVSDRELMPRISKPASVRTLFGYARTTARSMSEAGVR
jgi:GT2 family glycosyltransferase